jgi:hypothetical protein
MPIRCECGHCKTEFLAPDNFAGRTLACPVCEKWVSAPGGKPGAAPAPEPPPPEPLADILDETLGPAGATLDGGQPVGTGSSSFAGGVWASDGTWLGMGRRSRREIVRIPLQAGIAIFAIGFLVFFALIIAALPKAAAVIGWITFWTGGVGLILVGLGWEALIAMRERTGPGIFVLIPPVDLYYFMGQWDKTRKAFLTVLAGMAICGGSLGTVFLADYLAGRQESGARDQDSGFRVQGSGATSAHSLAPSLRHPVTPSPSHALTPSPGQPVTLSASPVSSPPPLNPPPPTPGPAFPDSGAMDPIGRAYEEAGRQYAIRTAVDLVAGDDETLVYRTRWFPAGRRLVIGLRWGLGVEVADPMNPAVQAAVKQGERLIGAVALGLVAGLEGRIKAGAFGDWPEEGDPRCRQVAILRTGTRQELVAAARARRLDMLILLRPVALSSANGTPSAVGPVAQTLVEVQVFDAMAGKPLWTSQAIGGAVLGPPGAAGWDPVAVGVGEVLQYVRDYVELRPVGDLTTQQVRARLKEWEPEGGRAEIALLLLVELRYYQIKKLLPTDEVAKELDALVGLGRGRLLATEPPVKRRELVLAWLKELGAGG